MMQKEPIRNRLQTQKEYGIPEGEEGMLAWEMVRCLLQEARNYWLVTVTPDNHPHAVPVWGVWLDGRLYFGMGRETKKARNLGTNPNIVLHLDSNAVPVILEGSAQEITDPALQIRIDDAYEAKYEIRHGTPVFELLPRKAFAWDENYPVSATRWEFE